MVIDIDRRTLEEIKKVVNDKLPQWLLNNTTEFASAAAILEWCFDGIEKVEKELNK
jgi:hypothetical protein